MLELTKWFFTYTPQDEDTERREEFTVLERAIARAAECGVDPENITEFVEYIPDPGEGI